MGVTNLRGFNPNNHVFSSKLFEGVVNEAIDFFTATAMLQLPPELQFEGAGVYALYYFGDLEFYKSVSLRDDKTSNRPIYVGKAVPHGWRTARSKDDRNTVVYNRLREHSRSINQCENLNLSDFQCRFIILTGKENDLVIPIEAELIRRYAPLWNSTIDGFGNHDPGAGRREQAKSEWDVLHPGRPWVQKQTGIPPNLQEIKQKIEKDGKNLGFS